jgi:hypothetical protein
VAGGGSFDWTFEMEMAVIETIAGGLL